MTHVNTATHPVDLADGTIVPPGKVATPTTHPHDQALVADGTLTPAAEAPETPEPEPTTAGRRARSQEGGA